MLGAATLAGAHSSGNGAPSQDAVSGAMVMRSAGEMQVACLRTRGMALAMLSSVRAWRRVARSMLRDCGWFGGVVLDGGQSQAFWVIRAMVVYLSKHHAVIPPKKRDSEAKATPSCSPSHKERGSSRFVRRTAQGGLHV